MGAGRVGQASFFFFLADHPPVRSTQFSRQGHWPPFGSYDSVVGQGGLDEAKMKSAQQTQQHRARWSDGRW